MEHVRGAVGARDGAEEERARCCPHLGWREACAVKHVCVSDLYTCSSVKVDVPERAGAPIADGVTVAPYGSRCVPHHHLVGNHSVCLVYRLDVLDPCGC